SEHAGGGGSWARRLASAPEQEQDRAVLEVVLGQVASLLGHASPEEVEARRTFKELGFDSAAAVELRNRLAAIGQLRLPAPLVVDHPTPVAVARYLRGQITGAQDGAPARAPSVAVDEPIAIVGMSCRYPGGVSSPGELWQLLASGTDAIDEFPSDRGWELGHL